MNVFYLIVLTSLSISRTCGVKDDGAWYLSKTGHDISKCGRKETSACKTIEYLLGKFFNQTNNKEELDLKTDTSFLINSEIQGNFTMLAELNVTLSVHNDTDTVQVTLDHLHLSHSVWQFTGINVTVTNCYFPTSSFTIAPAKFSLTNNINSLISSSHIGSVRFDEIAEVHLQDCVVDGMERINNNSAIDLFGTTARITGSTFNKNQLQTPLIVINDGSHVLIENTNITDNNVINGTIYVDNNSTLTLHQCFFTRNYASLNGGCILLLHFSQLFTNNTKFLKNTARNNGGVIMSEFNTRIEIGEETIFDRNRVLEHDSSGGAISNFYNVTLTVSNSILRNNFADYQGGVISAMENSTVLLFNATFLNNTALDSSGAIRCYHHCILTAKQCVFKDNTANDGGGIESVNATLNFDNCTFENNTSLITDTGALTAVSNSTVNVRNCTFFKNRAGRYGPVMQFYGSVHVNIEHSNFTNNIGQYAAGAIYVENDITLRIKGSYFVNNTGSRGGGALLGGLTTSLHVSDSYFINNTAITGAGGAIDYFGHILLENTHFINNTAGYRGGAIGKIVNTAATYINATDCTFVNNYAELDGGAIFCVECKVTSIRSDYTGNYVRNEGGAVYVITKSYMEVENGTFRGNYAKYGNGGAVKLADQSELNMKGSHLVENSGNYGGGAIHMYASKNKPVTNQLQHVHFENNHVHFMGAAMYVGPWVKITASNCWFVGNNADTYGGAVKMDESTESCFERCMFINNTAKMQGGAMYVKQQQGTKSPQTQLKLANCVFLDNNSKKATAIYIFSDMNNPSPELKTLNTVISCAASFNLNTSEVNFKQIATKLNMIVSEPDPELDVTETPFASVTPGICHGGCNCYYNQALTANIYDCTTQRPRALPDSLEKGANWMILKRSNITSLCTYKTYLKDIEGLDISHSMLQYICDGFLQSLFQHKTIKTFKFQHSKVKKLPRSIQNYTFEKLYIGNNPYQCTCSMTWMYDWLIDTSTSSDKNYVKDFQKAICTSGIKKVRGKPIYRTDGGKMGCDIVWYEIAIPVALSVFIITSTLLLINRYVDALRFQLFLKFDILTGKDDDQEHLEDFDFDLFVSHSHLDNLWFTQRILPYLEKEHHYDICIPERDWDPTSTISDCITTAIDSSRRMIIVLSKNYIQSSWCMEEFLMAHARLKEGRKKLLIPIMMEDITEEDLDPTLKLYIKAHHYIKVTNDFELLRKKLVYAMPRTPLCELLAAESAEAAPADCHVQINGRQVDPNQAGPSNRDDTDAAPRQSTIHGFASDKFVGRLNKKGYPGDKMRARMLQRYKSREANFRKGKAKHDAAVKAAAAEQQYSSDTSDESDHGGTTSSPSDDCEDSLDDQVYSHGNSRNGSLSNPTESTPLLLQHANT